jgi:glucose/arabinose dehydrogenase
MPRVPALAVLVVAASVLAACENRTPPPTPSPSPGGGETITGRERLGWDQRADSSGELATFGYAIYVDGVRAEIAEVVCAVTAGAAGFPCSGRLPVMSAGAHTLELASFRQEQADIESARSTSLRVTVTGASAGDEASDSWRSGYAGVTADGIDLWVERLAEGLEQPTDAAFDPFGRLFISERAGRIRLVDDQRLLAAPALMPDEISADGGLLALALDPDFARTRHVFTLSTAPSRRGTVFRLARYRELRGVLAQRAILLETAAPAAPAGALRVGPDGKLYLALGPATTDDPGAYVGKVLRLNIDGTAPRDRRAAMPIAADRLIAPRALAWQPGGGTLWIADGDGRDDWITGVGAADSAPPRASWAMPAGAISSALAFYDHERMPALRGQLFIASAAARRLLRVHFDPANPLRIASAENLLEDRVGPIRIVLSGPDGAIYFCTEGELGRLVDR